jgi:hypothetical protein
MSLPASPDSPIPEETFRVAHAAFPKGNVFMRMRDALGPIDSNPQFGVPGAVSGKCTVSALAQNINLWLG